MFLFAFYAIIQKKIDLWKTYRLPARKITVWMYHAVSLTAMGRRSRGNLPTRSIQRWRLMIVWPSNYHRVLLPPMCNSTRERRFLYSRLVCRAPARSRLDLAAYDERRELFSSIGTQSKTVPSVRSTICIYPYTAQADNSHLMRLCT